MKTILNKVLQSIDKIYVNPYLKLFGDFSGILCLCFHTVFEREEEKNNKHTIPNIGLTIDEYRKIFNYFLDNKYEFISFNETKKLISGRKYIHISFDDGYFNNTKILPILEEFNIPCNIFVVTNNIKSSEKFWWDIVYSKRISDGSSLDSIYKEIAYLQKKHFKELNEYIHSNIGTNFNKPLSDLDRPLSEVELKQLSRNKLVTIGNHTSDHAVLNNLSNKEVYDQIKDAQIALNSIIGYYPNSFAFPNNSYNKGHLKILDEIGIQFGFSGDFRHNRIPNGLKGEKSLRLGRFSIFDNRNMDWQLKMLRAGITPFIMAKELKRSIFN